MKLRTKDKPRFMIERTESERLILRLLEESDAPARLDYYKRNQNFFQPFMPEMPHDFCTFEYQLERIKINNGLSRKDSEFRYFVFKKDDPEKIIGNVSISHIIRGVLQSAFLGYSIDENENGKGIATEAIKKIIELSFGEIKLHRLEANVIPSNIASLRILEKLNFTKEGFSKDYCEINGKWEDHFRYAILNKNFQTHAK